MKKIQLKISNIIKSSLMAMPIVLAMFTTSVKAQNEIKGCATACNLIKNGDFNGGTAGFSSALPQGANNCTAGSWTVGPTLKSKCNLWPNTGGNPGAFMSIDGSTTNDNVDVWKKQVTLCQGITYTFSFDGINVYPTGSVDVGLVFDNNPPIIVHVTSTQWIKYTATTTFTGVGTHTIAIRQMTKGDYRDFGIDNVFFGFCTCQCNPQ